MIEGKLSSHDRHVDGVPASISVIVPTCDRRDFLRDALDSVLAQTLVPREVLVIDNGTTEAAEEGGHQLVRYHRLGARIGPSRARNFGAAMARGDMLAFLDDDDWWEPDFLHAAFAVMRRDGVRCVYGRKVESRGVATSPYKLVTPEELTIPTLLRRNPGTGGMNLLIERRLFLEVGGFDDRLRISEDRALALDLLMAGVKIGIAPDAVAVVRHHAGERLRRRHLNKLSFVSKYRRLYSPGGLIAALGRILASALWPLHKKE